MTAIPRSRVAFFLLFAFACLLSPSRSEETPEQTLVVSVERIWDRAGHSAFTDIAEFRGWLYCTFREGSGHIPGINGTIRVIRSADRMNWESVALLSEPHVDLRDPKLSITPDGRLMVSMGASSYHGSKRLGIESRTAFSNTEGDHFDAPVKVELPANMVTGFDWLWRTTWREGVAWACVQRVPDSGARDLWLVKSSDGVHFEPVAKLEIGTDPTETTLRFQPDGTMIAMARAVPTATPGRIGTAKPPYVDWKFQVSNQAFGGPNFIALPDGSWLAGGRDQNSKPHRTRLWKLDVATAKLSSLLALPSDGDNSYPGFVVDKPNRVVYISYYSSHEGKAAIYLATLRLDALTAKHTP